MKPVELGEMGVQPVQGNSSGRRTPDVIGLYMRRLEIDVVRTSKRVRTRQILQDTCGELDLMT